MKPIFCSTRGYAGVENFLDVVRLGLAPDGGLFVPCEFDQPFTTSELGDLVQKNYLERALTVLERFPVNPLTDSELGELLREAYSEANFANLAVAPVRKLNDQQYLLELFHGPTAAFKDLALQLTPRFFGKAVQNNPENYLILAATSGDTGVATIAGYADLVKLKVAVLYPAGGVSPVQEQQMLALQSENIKILPIQADFDFCQRTVKQIFTDTELKQTLLKQDQTKLSSANSINWGRLLPQVAYWFSGYLDLVNLKAVILGEPIDITVPTGNFGNIFAAHLARKLGLPIKKLIIASNENNVLTEFIQTGRINLTDRKLRLTASPSIDILRSSNLERMLWLITDRDTARVAELVGTFEKTGQLEINSEELAEIQEIYAAGWCSEADCAQTIQQTFAETSVLLDTHTAIAKKVADTHQADCPMLIAATAHWAKFPASVLAALGGDPTNKSVAELYAAIQTQTGAEPHGRLAAIVDKKLDPPTALPANYEQISAALQQFCG
jgi:threonine synthase